MSTQNVLRLAEYRDRRDQRQRLAESLHGADRFRRSLLKHVGEATSITGADRGAVVWVDEYGPGLVHSHVVLDLLCDRPRRVFPVEPLRKAWDLGVPGAFDESLDGSSTLAIALGSDGTRAWFLVASAISPRPPLDRAVRERLMFLAGECSAVVLHRDLDALEQHSESADTGFAGWSVLEDVADKTEDDPERARVLQRFAIARLVRMLLDEDLVVADERIAEQCRRARDEIARVPLRLPEAELWSDVLAALESADLLALCRSLIRLGDEIERDGHLHGARETYRSAFSLAAALGLPDEAVESSRYLGRVLRRMARWDEARDWYGVAERIANASGCRSGEARAMAGSALVHHKRGNLPQARAGLLEALVPAEMSGDADTVGSIYHDLMSVEQMAGDHVQALKYGWLAVRTYETEQAQVRGLAGLAGALEEAGEYSSSEDAWLIVAQRSTDVHYRLYALDALAYLAALRGDGAAFDRRAARADALGWEDGSPEAKSEFLFYRGLSCRALGRMDDARRWLERAVAFAEEHEYNQTLFKAEAALESLEESRRDAAAAGSTDTAPPELRLRLREMRVDLVGAGA